MSVSTSTLGTAFAEALAAKDFARVAALLHPQVDFGGLTPSRSWEATGPEQVVSDVLREWLEDSTDIEELLDVQTNTFANCEHVGYRFRAVTRRVRSSSSSRRTWRSGKDSSVGCGLCARAFGHPLSASSSGWIRTTDLTIMSGLGARKGRRRGGHSAQEIPARGPDPDDPAFRE
jgi:hypothetical protein